MKHKFDMLTNFCIRCGMSLEEMIDHERPDCSGGDNVIAISHILCHRKMERLLGNLYLSVKR